MSQSVATFPLKMKKGSFRFPRTSAFGREARRGRLSRWKPEKTRRSERRMRIMRSARARRRSVSLLQRRDIGEDRELCALGARPSVGKGRALSFFIRAPSRPSRQLATLYQFRHLPLALVPRCPPVPRLPSCFSSSCLGVGPNCFFCSLFFFFNCAWFWFFG